MKCPSCTDSILSMTDRQGVEIDFCPQCRGVWLDRGELDKLLDRAVPPGAAVLPGNAAGPTRARQDYEPHGDSRYGYSSQQRKRKSWLHEIFD